MLARGDEEHGRIKRKKIGKAAEAQKGQGSEFASDTTPTDRPSLHPFEAENSLALSRSLFSSYIMIFLKHGTPEKLKNSRVEGKKSEGSKKWKKSRKNFFFVFDSSEEKTKNPSSFLRYENKLIHGIVGWNFSSIRRGVGRCKSVLTLRHPRAA
jgi:hypothetical protein